MTQTTAGTRIDFREIDPRERRLLIDVTFRKLEAGETLELIDDHDPGPLYHQFQAEMPGRFSWDCLPAGPDVWHVRIGKLGKAHGDGQCCGSCGGA